MHQYIRITSEFII